MVQVKDLPDLFGKRGVRPMLYCELCGAENSADKGDYFNLPPDFVFECCGEPMELVTKHTIYRKAQFLRLRGHSCISFDYPSNSPTPLKGV